MNLLFVHSTLIYGPGDEAEGGGEPAKPGMPSAEQTGAGSAGAAQASRHRAKGNTGYKLQRIRRKQHLVVNTNIDAVPRHSYMEF